MYKDDFCNFAYSCKKLKGEITKKLKSEIIKCLCKFCYTNFKENCVII